MGIDISCGSQAKLNELARRLKDMLPETLGFRTPTEMFSQPVALIP